MNPPQFIVAQLGARMHYAVPRILAANAMLEHLFTDFSANQGWPSLFNLVPQAVRPQSLNRMLGRIAQRVPTEKTTAFNVLGMRYARRLRAGQSTSDQTSAFLWAGKQFCRRVLARGFGNANAVYTFNTAGLEVLLAARRKGLLAVMEQTIAPKQIEVELLQAEHAAYPEWEPDGTADTFAPELVAREAAEWDAANLILCASEFVRDGIERCSGPVEKCVVVPYGVDVPEWKAENGNRKSENREEEAGNRTSKTPHPNTTSSGLRPPNDSLAPARSALGGPSPWPNSFRHFPSSGSPQSGEGNLPKVERENNRPLRVLTVGSVGLRKGSPYVLEAAQQLNGKAVFRMVGGIGVEHEAEQQLRKHLELTGPIPRNEIAAQFAWANVFLLPSLCEGSATVTYEAIAHGLPVICTPNTGSIIRDGVEGFIVPIRDAAAIVEKLRRLLEDSELLSQMSANAVVRAREFTVARYGDRLINALQTACPN